MERYDNHFDRAEFDAVWQRVIGAASGNSPTHKPETQHAVSNEADTLRRFMDDASGDTQFYLALARRCSGMMRQTLERISTEKKHHLKKLHAKYFILTGKTYTPPGVCPLIYSVADALRRKYAGEKDGAALYLTASENTSNMDLTDTYLALSEDSARHSRLIGCLIEKMF